MDWRKSENCCIQKIAFHIVDGEELGEKEGFHIVDGEELGGYPQIIRVIRVIRPNYSMKTYENHLKPMVTLRKPQELLRYLRNHFWKSHIDRSVTTPLD